MGFKKFIFFSLITVFFSFMFLSCDLSVIFTRASKKNLDTDDSQTIETVTRTQAAAYMQDFIQDISSYARGQKPGFIIIPQNAEELAFVDASQRRGISTSYLNAVDGFGIEELFFNDRGRAINDRDRVSMLETLRDRGKKILVSDYVLNNDDYSYSAEQNYGKNFIAFPRANNNYDYKYIPAINDSIAEMFLMNDDDIITLSDAKNYLYLIRPNNYGNSKDRYLEDIRSTDYDVILIDLFFGGRDLTAYDLAQLKTKNNGASRLVISYISIGSAENYRYYWKQGWKIGSPSWILKSYPGYSSEYWVRYWDPQWQDIIFGNDQSYIKRIINAGFDGVYLDNVEAYLHIN